MYERNRNFITINGPEIMSKSYGASEGRLREIFREAEDNAPSIIFIDKIDAIAPKDHLYMDQSEKRVVAQLLTLMDGFHGRGNVIIIAETSNVDDIDSRLRHPGRFDREIELKVPDIAGRCEILKIHTRQMPLQEEVDLQVLAELTQGYVGADLELLVKEAGILAMREILPQIEGDKPAPPEILGTLQIKMEHFLNALNLVHPSNSA